MDHRDYKAGARITAKDVESTLEYAKKHLIDNYDLNQNGLSRTEIEKITGKLSTKSLETLEIMSTYLCCSKATSWGIQT